MFQGLPCLEIGCWRGWSTVHFALGSANLEAVDPVLRDPAFRADVEETLRRAGVSDRVTLHDGASPEEIERICGHTGKRWSMVFIDGDHEGDAPRLDAEVVQHYCAEHALILLHDLVSPHVAGALAYLRDQGWETWVYQTMQIMGVAVRGGARPIMHVPDPSQSWRLPDHLACFPVVGESRGTRVLRIETLLAGAGRSTQDVVKRTLPAIDALPEDEAAVLDSLLVRAGAAAGRLGGEHLSSESEAARAFERLRLKHVDLLQKLSDLEPARDDLERQLQAAQRLQEQTMGEVRRATQERDALEHALERAIRKLSDLESRHQDLKRQLEQLEPCQEGELSNIAREAGAAPTELSPAAAAHEEIRRFAHRMASKRVLTRLTRKLLAGRTAKIRSLINESMHKCGVPEAIVASSIDRLSKPRVILGLVVRRALARRGQVEGRVLEVLELQSVDVEARLEAELRRLRALEAAKLADEKALLEAQLTIAKLRGPLPSSATLRSGPA
jgi:hypothetical protein